MKIGDIEIYEVPEEIMTYYRHNVKGNEYTSPGQITLKLARNIYLADKTKSFASRKITYMYGNLKIVVQGNKVVEIENIKGDHNSSWTFDKNEYYRVSKVLGIVDYKEKFKRKKSFVKQ